MADRITVIRDGATVRSFDCRSAAASEDEVIRAMVGRAMADRYPKRTPRIGDTVFEVRDWQVHHPEHADRLVRRLLRCDGRLRRSAALPRRPVAPGLARGHRVFLRQVRIG